MFNWVSAKVADPVFAEVSYQVSVIFVVFDVVGVCVQAHGQ